jgi:hypothetical protein
MRPLNRRLAAAALASVAAALLSTPPATGTPTVTQVPEQPRATGLTEFTDDPAIVDARPQPFESWSRRPDDRSIGVHFTTGTPQCYGVHAEVQETPDVVAVRLLSGTRPDAVGKACIEIAVFGELPVRLDSPIGQRAVVSIT